MYYEAELKQLADKTLGFTNGYDVEIMLSAKDKALTRFGENVITQNVSGSEIGFSVRLLKDGRMGKASTGNISDEGIRKCVKTAEAALKVSEPEDKILPLPNSQQYRPIDCFAKSTQELGPENRADGVTRAVEMCKEKNLQAAGIFSSEGGSMAIANSKGLWAYHDLTTATFSLSAMSGESSGWAEETDQDVGKINIESIADKAIRIALDSRKPGTVEPGAYTVIFEPAAVADFMLFLGWDAFNGLALVEGRSCFSGKVGQKVVGDNITITDDAYNPLTPGLPFDFEGLPRQKVTMIENGVFHGTVHDRRTAALAGVEQTGHALPQPDTAGPLPLNVVVSPGESTAEEMIASVKRGLYVTRLHYTNILDPMKMTLTGMTRDGFFLIEDGKIVKGLKNMRFTESVLNILSNVEMMSRELYKTGTFWGGGGTVAPIMKVNDFHFTSKTEN